MDGVPTLPLNPEDIEGELTPEQWLLVAESFVILSLYVQEQNAKCGIESRDGGP